MLNPPGKKDVCEVNVVSTACLIGWLNVPFLRDSGAAQSVIRYYYVDESQHGQLTEKEKMMLGMNGLPLNVKL